MDIELNAVAAPSVSLALPGGLVALTLTALRLLGLLASLVLLALPGRLVTLTLTPRLRLFAALVLLALPPGGLIALALVGLRLSLLAHTLTLAALRLRLLALAFALTAFRLRLLASFRLALAGGLTASALAALRFCLLRPSLASSTAGRALALRSARLLVGLSAAGRVLG